MITSGEWCWGTSFYHIGSHYGFLFFRCPTSFYNRPKEYFKDSQDKAKGKIKRIKIIGTNDAGSFEVDTNITGMKHFLKVKGESVTNEVESSDFFVKAQEFIASMGGRI